MLHTLQWDNIRLLLNWYVVPAILLTWAPCLTYVLLYTLKLSMYCRCTCYNATFELIVKDTIMKVSHYRSKFSIAYIPAIYPRIHTCNRKCSLIIQYCSVVVDRYRHVCMLKYVTRKMTMTVHVFVNLSKLDSPVLHLIILWQLYDLTKFVVCIPYAIQIHLKRVLTFQ